MKNYIKSAVTIFAFILIGVIAAKFVLLPFMEYLYEIDLTWWQNSLLIALPVSLILSLPSAKQ